MRLIDFCNFYSGLLDDMEIIKKFLVENNLESEAISMIPMLAEAKIEKQRRENDRVKEKVHEMSICTYAAFYEPTLADLLQRVNLRLSIDEGNFLTPDSNIMKALREEVLKHELNVYMNREVLNFLHDNGIYFKDEAPEAPKETK